ncbi:putative 2OG-Fe(II) oxygenase [Streptomyces sp. Edi2]|uniref:putative 2OG-Fe(II) oxygenase n=1 Tax=Streptomyces sp. Edi2 TaxID=3162528 RepID=UPI003305C24B
MTTPTVSTAVAEPWQVRGARQELWPTPVYQRATAIDADVDALAELILEREQGDSSLSLGVTCARKSAPDVLSWPLPAVTALNGWIRDAALAVTGAGPDTAFTATAWAVRYWSGGFHEFHAHHDSAVSGVYYLRTATDPTGALELLDPRPAHLATAPAHAVAPYAVVPYPGLLIAFPSWLRHGVAPHHSPTPRLCIAFNIRVEER